MCETLQQSATYHLACPPLILFCHLSILVTFLPPINFTLPSPQLDQKHSQNPKKKLKKTIMDTSVSAHQLKQQQQQPFRNLEIPPRKLLTRRLAALSSQPSMEMHEYPYSYSPRVNNVHSEETLYQKFLSNNNSCVDDDGSDDPYASDEFRMYVFKIKKCTRSRSHDWTDCPFAHPGEKARRRCPRRFGYSGTVCPEFCKGSCCVRGDGCEFAHGVFECWLHPSRYRTEACKDGKSCQRKICFFAHSSGQLRAVPVHPSEMVVSPNTHANSGRCGYCRCNSGGHHHNPSPTSIFEMDSMSPPSTPPISPAQYISRWKNKNASCSYKDSRHELMTPQAIEELMYNMKVMNMNATDSYAAACNNDDEQSFFSVSPSTPYPSVSGSSRVCPGECSYAVNKVNEERVVNESAISGPDVKWVNDLLT